MKSFGAAWLIAILAKPGAATLPIDRKPSKAAREAFEGCRWGRVDGQVPSIWTSACDKTHGDQRLVPANDVGGFAIVPPNPGPGRQILIRSFAKVAKAPVASILPAVLRATGRYKRSCRLIEHRRYGDWGTIWTLEPTGSELRAYEAANSIEPQENPCGVLGIGPAGDRFFRVLPGEPTRVIYADMGSEVQIFDLKTLAKRP
ncbi:hypothetical protein GGQ80_001726 [Sphingomonas jinjuensis]|uniref:Uncharacterized protein n=1 Tax=Sphingomonas jinjuensis TaxID=535907 RepID=A0A840F7B0_9SPHN|nr:hypothetical protein [Sphingomonas jinjuensis]MBB4153820.1 hypothetical protein [Sphingomonas jinjuensis]